MKIWFKLISVALLVSCILVLGFVPYVLKAVAIVLVGTVTIAALMFAIILFFISWNE